MKVSARSQKLGGIIAELLPPLVEKFLTPNQVGFLTITAVEVSGDLGLVDAYINVMGANSRDAIKSLAKVTPKIRFELLQKIKLRREFILRWKVDLGRMNINKFNTQD
jgi:ribosome-binding factor A